MEEEAEEETAAVAEEEEELRMDNLEGIVLCLEALVEEVVGGEEEDFNGKRRTESGADILSVFCSFSRGSVEGVSTIVERTFVICDEDGVVVVVVVEAT